MTRAAFTLSALLVSIFVTSAAQVAPRPGVDWPSFRGIRANGIADGAEVPTRFSPASAVWKTPVPGIGNSSPIIWGEILCVTTAVSADTALRTGLYGDIESVADASVHEWKVLCLNKRNGAVRWQQTIHKGIPKIKRHMKATHANSTLATDGTHLAALLGSEGLHVFDLNGKLLWKKDLGVLDSGFFMVPEAQWEFGSSPIIHAGILIVQADVQKGSFLSAFDVKTGKEIWRSPRADVPTWSTPAITGSAGQEQIVVNGWKHSGGYDLRTGREIWKLTGGGDIPVPTPVFGHGLIFLTSAHGPASPVYAIRSTATGDISLLKDQTSNANVSWSAPRDGSYMATPIIYGDLLYVVRWNGVMSAYDAISGARVYQQRLGEGTSAFTASPIANNGRLYFASEEGDVFVVRAGTSFELLAVNKLDAVVLASPAISEGRIFIRTKDQVMAFGR